MTEFINTIDALGDDAVVDSILMRTITEFKDNEITTVRSYAFTGCPLVNIELPNATVLGSNAFYGCKELETVYFPAVTSVEYQAFKGPKSKLKTANLPAALTIGDYAFGYAYSLENVNLPLATSIGGYAFTECNKALKFIDLPCVTNINNSAFVGCSKLETVILRSETLCALGMGVFTRTPIESGTGYIYVPAALVDSYKAASNWSTYANQIRAIEDYPEICGT